jgi:hypothetical protein
MIFNAPVTPIFYLPDFPSRRCGPYHLGLARHDGRDGNMACNSRCRILRRKNS